MMQWSAVSEKPAPSWSEGNLLISSKHWYIPAHHRTVSSPKTDKKTSLDKLPWESTDFHYHCEFFILQCDGISIQEWDPHEGTHELPYLEDAERLSSTNFSISMNDHQVNCIASTSGHYSMAYGPLLCILCWQVHDSESKMSTYSPNC
jgi:hypothetical protein